MQRGRRPAGALTSDPMNIANAMVKFFSGVSAALTCSVESQQMVLQPLAAARHLSSAQADLLDTETVSEAEVLEALANARPGTSPGPDGLPMDLFRRYHVQSAPLLFRLFTAMLKKDALPQAFHDGTIVVLYKAGDRTDPANYRPITRLNADYRNFTTVQSSKLSAAFPYRPPANSLLGQRSMGKPSFFSSHYHKR